MEENKKKSKRKEEKNENAKNVEKEKVAMEVESSKATGKKRRVLPSKFSLKTVLPLLLVIILAVGGYLLYNSYFVAAKVNGEAIGRLEVIKTLEQQGGSNILSSLIDRRIIKQEAARRNIVATPQEIQNEVQEIESQYAAQGLTLEDLLSYQNMTRESLDELLEIQILLEKLVGSSFIVSDEEIDQYIETNEEAFAEEEITDEMREQIREQLKSQKQQQEMQNFMQQKRQEAQIEYVYYTTPELPF